MLTPEQREAAISLMADGIAWRDDNWRDIAARALDALLSEFVVIAKDDVTERHDYAVFGTDGRMRSCWLDRDHTYTVASEHDEAHPDTAPHHVEHRVALSTVTRWEPIT